MSTELRETITQAIGDHRYSIADSPVHRCVCGEEIGRGQDAIDAHRADAVLAALQAGGWEVGHQAGWQCPNCGSTGKAQP